VKLLRGALVSVYAFCQLLAGPIIGQLSDRHGRKPILLISQIGSVAGYVVLALSNTIWLIFAVRVLDGLTSGNMSVAQAYVSDNSSLTERTRALGVTGAAFGVGTMLGPAIGGLMAVRSIHTPIWIAACLSATSALCTMLLLPTGKSRSAALRSYKVQPLKAMVSTFRNPDTGRIGWLLGCFYFSLSMYMSGQA
jgi:multidrug resistance protein